MSEELNDSDILHAERARIEKLKTGKAALRNERNFLRRKHLEALAESAELRADNDRLRNELSGKTGELEKCKNGIAFYIEAGKVLSYEIKSLKKDISDIRTKFLESQRVVGELTAEVARLKASLEKLSVKENYYIINDHGMVYIGGDYKIYYTETAGQDDYHHPADIARAALAESAPK